MFATGVNKVYDGTSAATVTLAPDDGVVAGDVLSYAYGGASFADKNAGAGKGVSVAGINVSGEDAANYAWNTSAATFADITPRALTVNASGVDRLFDGTTAATVLLADNRLANDVLTLANSSASFADPTVGEDKAVSVAGISVGGTDAANYSWNTTAATTASILAVGVEPAQVPKLPVFVPTLPATTRVPSPLVLTLAAAFQAQSGAANAPGTAGITVTLVRPSSGAGAGAVTVTIPKDMVSRGESFSFPLPAAVTQALAVGGASARITRTDDTPLPPWLRYVPQSQTFDVTAAPAGTLPFEVKITVDGASWTLILAETAGK